VLRIRDILVRIRMRIRILGFIPLMDPTADPGGPKTSGCGSGKLVPNSNLPFASAL
jgi:hypothetical protein